MHQIKLKQSGFTLIEIIVSLALFSVVITIAVGALLILIASNRQLQNEQSVLSNLSFALDSMTREIRTGYNYQCVGSNSRSGVFNDTSTLDDAIDSAVQDCQDGGRTGVGDSAIHGITFIEGGQSVTDGNASRRIVYFYDSNDGKLYRRLSGRPAESIVSDGLFISDADFYVTGSGRSDDTQPKVSIVLRAYNSEEDATADALDGDNERAFVIQTTVTQRSLDINER